MRRAPVLVLAVTVALALGGCVSEPPLVIPDESPSVEPVFASDEEALAAAEEAYGAYVRSSDEILADGGANPERVSPLISDALLNEVLEGFAIYSDRGWRTVGSTAFDSVELQQHVEELGFATVVAYLCADVSAVRILDSGGVDVTPQREERLPLEVEFYFEDESSGLLNRTEVWSGDNFCD